MFRAQAYLVGFMIFRFVALVVIIAIETVVERALKEVDYLGTNSITPEAELEGSYLGANL